MNVVIQSSEVTSMKRDLDKQKEVASASEIKIKWNQNKLKAEQDAHKVCRSCFSFYFNANCSPSACFRSDL